MANELRRRRPRCSDKWHMDEVVLTIRGKKHSLWRAVDQDGNVLDILVQSRRNKKAAKRFFRKLLKGLRYVPRVILTDKLKSYAAAKREILPGVEHRQHKGLNNRAENSHQPPPRHDYARRKSNSFVQLITFVYGSKMYNIQFHDPRAITNNPTTPTIYKISTMSESMPIFKNWRRGRKMRP